jgi:hypothetical protein
MRREAGGNSGKKLVQNVQAVQALRSVEIVIGIRHEALGNSKKRTVQKFNGRFSDGGLERFGNSRNVEMARALKNLPVAI